MKPPARGAVLRNLLAAVATTCALLLAFVVNCETRRLGARFQVEQERTLAQIGRVILRDTVGFPAGFPGNFVPNQHRPSLDTTWQMYNLGSAYAVQAALRRLDTMVARDSIPVLLALRGLALRKLSDRPRALEDLVWAKKNAKRREAVVSQIAFEFAGLTLAESGYQLVDTNVTEGHRLLRRALVYYDTALGYDAGAFATSIHIRSLRERVRTTLGENKRDVDRARPGGFATIIFVLGMVVCLVGIVAAIVALARPRPE